VNKFTAEFISDFCDSTGAIDWEKLVAFSSAISKPKHTREAAPDGQKKED